MKLSLLFQNQIPDDIFITSFSSGKEIVSFFSIKCRTLLFPLLCFPYVNHLWLDIKENGDGDSPSQWVKPPAVDTWRSLIGGAFLSFRLLVLKWWVVYSSHADLWPTDTSWGPQGPTLMLTLTHKPLNLPSTYFYYLRAHYTLPNLRSYLKLMCNSLSLFKSSSALKILPFHTLFFFCWFDNT